MNKSPEAETNKQYRLLLHNDDFNSMEYVVKTMIDIVPKLSEPQAVNAMMEAHHQGVGLITVCDSATAKAYCETLCDRELNATIEPVLE